MVSSFHSLDLFLPWTSVNYLSVVTTLWSWSSL